MQFVEFLVSRTKSEGLQPSSELSGQRFMKKTEAESARGTESARKTEKQVTIFSSNLFLVVGATLLLTNGVEDSPGLPIVDRKVLFIAIIYLKKRYQAPKIGSGYHPPPRPFM